MKITLFILLFVSYSLSMKAQITLEHTYAQYSISLTHLANSGYKYYYSDSTKVVLYNLDHSIWKTVNLNLPIGASVPFCWNISETLFNLDNYLELSYSYYVTTPIFTYTTKVINENGTLLLNIPNGSVAVARSTGANGYKLFVSIYDNSTTPATTATQIYSLVGSLPSFAKENNYDLLEVNPFPNPCIKSITIPYSLPSGINRAEIQIYNMLGENIKKYNIDRNFDNIIISTETFSSGTYIYKVLNDKEVFQTNKFIIE